MIAILKLNSGLVCILQCETGVELDKLGCSKMLVGMLYKCLDR